MAKCQMFADVLSGRVCEGNDTLAHVYLIMMAFASNIGFSEDFDSLNESFDIDSQVYLAICL